MQTCQTAETRFDSLILPNRAALTAQARRLTGGDMAEAEDLVQETLIRAYTHIDNITCEITIRGWLYAILRNLYINRYNQRVRMPRSFSLDEPNAENIQSAATEARPDIPESVVVQRMQQRAALSALSALPESFRIPIVLADIEGLAYQDIADRLKLPIGTVRSRIMRGRRRMRRSLYAWDTPLPVPRRAGDTNYDSDTRLASDKHGY